MSVGESRWMKSFVRPSESYVLKAEVPKEYYATLTQVEGSNPTVEVIKNELSNVIAWTQSTSKIILGTLSNAFPLNKTDILLKDMTDIESVELQDSSTVKITLSAEMVLELREIKILVYP